jgi:hypothetical protein
MPSMPFLQLCAAPKQFCSTAARICCLRRCLACSSVWTSLSTRACAAPVYVYMQELHLEMSVYKNLWCTCTCAFMLNLEGSVYKSLCCVTSMWVIYHAFRACANKCGAHAERASKNFFTHTECVLIICLACRECANNFLRMLSMR